MPWFFGEYRATSLLGMPYWAFYSLAATLFYALLIFFSLGRYWSLVSGKDEEEPEEGSK